MKELPTNTHHAIQMKWQREVYGDGVTVAGRLEKFREESKEVLDEVVGLDVESLSDQKRKALSYELVDSVLAAMGVLDAIGCDFENIFFERMEYVYKKYPPEVIKQMNLPPQEAVQILKEKWNDKPKPDQYADNA